MGSNQSCAGSNVALNAIAAWGVDKLCSEVEKTMAKDKLDVHAALGAALRKMFKKHRRILFDGDSYSEEWRREAARRGLSDRSHTPDALRALRDKSTATMFRKYSIFTERELLSRYEIYSDTYEKAVEIEANCALRILRTKIIPAALAYSTQVRQAGREAALVKYSARIRALLIKQLQSAEKLESLIGKGTSSQVLLAMRQSRDIADQLEMLIPANSWPMPTYADLLFNV